MNLFDLTKRTAFVSGATHGLGMSIALGLAEAGAKLIISSTSKKKLEKALSQYKILGFDVSGYVLDITNDEMVKKITSEVLKNYKVDILVNNSKQDSSTGDKQSWGSNSCSAGANLNSNFTNIIDKKLDKWNNRFSQRRLKCRKDGTGTKEKKFLKVFDICPSGCRFKNDKVFDKMYIAKFQIFLNNGEKDKFIYFPVHVDIKP